MRKRKTRTLFMSFLTVLCSVFVMSIAQESKVLAAENENVFEMTPGGSIRIAKPYGLRFQVKMSADVKNKADKVGMLIFPADYLVDNGTDGDVYYESVEALAETQVTEHRINLDLTQKVYEKDGDWYGNGAIVNIKEKNMAREFVGIAYYEVSGEVTFADTSKVKATTRSAAQIGLMAYQSDVGAYSGDVKQLLLKYIDSLKGAAVEDSAPTRYKVRGFAADDGLRFHVVQYVNNIVSTGAAWSEQTHVEAQIYQHNIGNGVQNGLNVATYCAFWLDGSSWFNNSTNIKNVTNQVSVTDRGEEFTAGYRYEIDYEIFIEFDNNLGNPKDGPYAYVQVKHHMPGESIEGFENSRKEHRDDSRYLWQDKSESSYVRPAGIIEQKWGIDRFTTKLENRKEQWERKANDGQTTLFIGDSFFDIYFWSNFYEEYYPGKDALLLGIGSTTTYDWETWASEWLANINPKNIVMHMGVNNVYADGDDAEATILGLKSMFSVIHEKLPNTPIYWFGISRPSHGEAKIAKVDVINEYMQEWCAEQDYITYIDTPSKLTADMLKDGTHPKLEYYTVFAEALAETDIVIEDLPNNIPFDFPKVEKFSAINSDLQSVDPNLYNFQMWTDADGLYTYFVQTVPSVTLDNSDNWKNTHVEMYLSNGSVGNGWNGTYIALFPDETVYINNLKNVRSAVLKVEIDQIDVSKTVLKYYFHLEFDNNTLSMDPSYAYVKPYQFLPGVTTTDLNSQVITKDGRALLTGDEVSFQVHDKIDKKMYN